MQRQQMIFWIIASVMLLIGTSLLAVIINTPSMSAHAATASPLSIVNATPTVSSSSSSTGGLDPIIIAALIGLGGVILGLLIGIFTSVYQTRRNAQLQQDLADRNAQLQRDLLSKQKELEREYKARERQELDEHARVEAAKQKMQDAQTNEQRAQAYREALRDDPRIASLQILDMKRPLAIANVYIRLRVHQELHTSPSLEMTQHDPNVVLIAEQELREQLFATALDPEDALRRYPRCIIVGDPGAGKTTLLKYLTLNAARGSLSGLPNLPIYIELNAFAVSKLHDLLDFAAVQWESTYDFPYKDAHAYMREQLRRGKALLLLDALDETIVGVTPDAAETSYTQVSQAILQIGSQYRSAPIVVTVRKAGYQQRAPLVGFTQLEVLDFRPEDIRQFVMNWYTYSQDLFKETKIADLTMKLERNPRIQALAANPLLLSLIVLVYEAQLDLPDRRADLYQRCMEILLREWDARRNIRRRREFKPEHKQQLLEIIAWHFHQQGRRYFPERELYPIIADFLPAIGLSSEQHREILEEITAEHGLLKEQAQGWYGFLHLTLQEYSAAQYVTDHPLLSMETLLKHRADPWWEEIFLLYGGATPDASPLLNALIMQGDADSLREDIFDTNLIMAGRCLATHPTILQPALRKIIITRLFDLLRKSPYTLTQRRVAEALAEIGGVEINTELIHLLSNRNIETGLRQRIAEATGKFGERSLALDLSRLLNIDEDMIVSIATALGELGDRSVAPKLMQLLSNKKLSDYTRGQIARALGRLGESSVVPELLQMSLEQELEFSTRYAIVDAIGVLGDQSIVPHLFQLLSTKKVDIDKRFSIIQILNKLGDRSLVPELIRLLSDPKMDQSGFGSSGNVRQNIVWCIGTLGDSSVVPDLLILLQDQNLDVAVRVSIADILSTLGNQSIVPQLQQLLSSSKPEASLYATIANTLGMLEDRSIVPDLLHLLTDKKVGADLRVKILVTLGQLKEQSAIPQLLRLLDQGNRDLNTTDGDTERFYVSIPTALGELGEPSITPKLLNLLSETMEGHNDWIFIYREVFLRNIATALGELGDQSVVPSLLQLLSKQVSQRGTVSFDEGFDGILDALKQLADDEQSVQSLVELLLTARPENVDGIHSALWTLSRKARTSLFTVDGQEVRQIEVVSW